MLQSTKHQGLWRTLLSFKAGEELKEKHNRAEVELSGKALLSGRTDSTNYKNKTGPLVGAHPFTSVTFILYLREHS